VSVDIGAPPSKRDLQTLTKALLTELTAAAVDGDAGLVRALCKECVHKSITLFLSKIESSISNHPETKRIQPLNTPANAGANAATAAAGAAGGGVGGFVRNSYQDNNVQLLMLLFHLRETVEKFPSQVLKSVQDNYNAGSSGDRAANAQIIQQVVSVDIRDSIVISSSRLDSMLCLCLRCHPPCRWPFE
jgi:hypothetical protein